MRNAVSREIRMAKGDKSEWKTRRILVGGGQDNYLNMNKQQEVSADVANQKLTCTADKSINWYSHIGGEFGNGEKV